MTTTTERPTKEVLKDKAALVAAALGDLTDTDWALTARHEHAIDLENATTGAVVTFWMDAYRGKLELIGIPPAGFQQAGFGWKRQAIGVGWQRPAGAIAGEIKRRLLPDYLPAYEDAKEKLVEHLARETEAVRVYDELCAVIGLDGPTERTRHWGRERKAYYNPASARVERADFSVPYHDRVCLDIHCKPELARRVLELLVSQRKGES